MKSKLFLICPCVATFARIANFVATMFILSQFFVPAAFAAPLFDRPLNDGISNALAIAGTTGTVRGSNISATKENWEDEYAGGTSVWYRWTAPASGEVRFDTAGSNFDTLLAIYLWTNRAQLPVPITRNDDVSNGVTTSLVTFHAEANVEYHIGVDGYGGATGAIQLSWVMSNVALSNVRVRAPAVPPNDNLANAQTISGRQGSVQGNNSSASFESWESWHASNTGGASVWYRWVSPVNGFVNIDTRGSQIDTLLAVYTRRTQTSVPVRVNSNDDYYSQVTYSRVQIIAESGSEYWIAVDGYGGATGNLTLNWEFPQNGETADLAITELYLPGQPRGYMYVRITNHGPDFLINQNVTIICDAARQCKAEPGYRCSQSIFREHSQRTILLTLRAGGTNQYSTSMLIDVSENSYPEVTCRLQGNDFHDPVSGNNTRTTSFR